MNPPAAVAARDSRRFGVENSPDAAVRNGSVRVLLGRYGRATSPIRAPADINYFHVRLKDGQRWRYAPPDGHTVAWLAVDKGDLRSPAPIRAGELAVFENSGGAFELQADSDTSFVVGSAIKHPHPLVLGGYSVHTSRGALAQGEAEIDRIGQRLRAAGRL
jgi:redox-sensitive bicupin YhaK (pirin superfamily)